MEPKDVVACGECGVENPKSRATCIVCHKPLRRKTDTGKDASAPEKKEAKAEKPAPKTTAKNPFEDKKEATATPKIKTEKKVIKRRARRKSRKPICEQFFILGDAGLIPVEINIKIKKVGDPTGDSLRLIDFYNRNRTLISG